ncbi:hypothetical protein BBJ28_00002143 [Nothophytophthora sp. Chile5]|nr:hypothetical protein BBJ28_00002143 [Nothophytophthora sp. Chile5]
MKVEQELNEIEEDMAVLLQRQSELLDRREELKERLAMTESGDAGDAAALSGGRTADVTPDWKGEFPWTEQIQTLLTGTIYESSCLLQVMLFNEIAGDGAACRLSGEQSRAEASAIYKELLKPESALKILLITPEKLIKSKLLMSRFEKAYQAGRLKRFDYSKLGILKRQFPTVPILALTATATPRLITDVKSILEIQKCVSFRTSFFRSNLHYEVMEKPARDGTAMDTLVNLVRSFPATDTGIVYCLTRKETEQVARQLRSASIRAACYHAYMEDKEETHVAWIRNKLQVVVATIAFGLGINKPDVRFVIHFTLSKGSFRVRGNVSTKRRVTLKQMIDEFKSKKFLQNWTHLEPEIPALSRVQCDSFVINLILRYPQDGLHMYPLSLYFTLLLCSMCRDVLQPEISYTAYNTICYLVPGSRAQQLLGGRLQILLPEYRPDAARDSEELPSAKPSKKRKVSEVIEID